MGFDFNFKVVFFFLHREGNIIIISVFDLTMPLNEIGMVSKYGTSEKCRPVNGNEG